MITNNFSILATGATGFIGKNLIETTGANSSTTRINDYHKLKKEIRGHDAVVHLAGMTGLGESFDRENQFVDVNVNGTYNVARICYEEKVRMINCSSSAVYNPVTPYARTKIAGEEIVSAFCGLGLSACSVRMFTVFGEHNNDRMAVYKFIHAIKKGDLVYLYGNPKREFTYVKDICHALYALAKNDTQGTHDLGFGDSLPVINIIREIERIMDKKANIIHKDPRSFDMDETKSKSDLMSSLTRKTPISIALENTIKYFQHG